MARRVPEQNLRGSDATLLEVQVQPLLAKPIGQLAPVNFLDLLALAEMEDPPRSLKGGLAKFVERMTKSVTDLPAGSSWDAFLDELADIDGGRVPETFRQMLAQQSDRDDRDAERIASLLERWSDQAPVPFTIGDKQAKLTRGLPTSAERSPSRSRRASASRRPTRSAAVTTEADRERQEWLTELCLERLGGASEQGLAEGVLIAGIRFRAKERYPSLTPLEITTVLKRLKETGRVKYSARRWSAVTRW